MKQRIVRDGLVSSICQMCQGLNSHYFHIIGHGHQPNSRGLYTHYKDSVIKGGRSPIPQKDATFDHGTDDEHFEKLFFFVGELQDRQLDIFFRWGGALNHQVPGDNCLEDHPS